MQCSFYCLIFNESFILGIDEFEEKVQNLVDNTGDENISSWIGQLVKNLYGSISDEENMNMQDDFEVAVLELK